MIAAPRKRIRKDRARQLILEHYGDPANALEPRKHWGQLIGHGARGSLWGLFDPQELDALEEEILAMRRERLAADLGRVDAALFKRAAEGDVAAVRLVYERFEGWKPGQRLEIHQGGKAKSLSVMTDEELNSELIFVLASMGILVARDGRGGGNKGDDDD